MTDAAKNVGIEFHVKDSLVTASQVGKNYKYFGEVHLSAHFNDEDTWNSIVVRLDGLVLNKGGDIQTELIALLQGQVNLLEEEVANQGTIDRERAQMSEAAATHSEQRAVRAEQHAELLQAQLVQRTLERDTAVRDGTHWYQQYSAICPSAQG